MHRAYIDLALQNTHDIFISDKTEIHHLKDVMRLKKGSRFAVFNGKGEAAECELVSISGQCINARILSAQQEPPHNRFHITLACAIPKKAKFEWILEKATELGADEIIPLKTERTEINLSSERSIKKDQRFQSVILNAVRQSRRLWIPKLHPITDFERSLLLIDEQSSAYIPCLIGERRALKDTFTPENLKPRIIIFIGPEGDFTESEVQSALAHGCIPVSLGKSILRVETAAIAVLATVQLLLNS